MATEEIKISELELADEVLADMVLPVDTATDTKAVTLKQLKAWLGTSLPIGSIFASVGKIDDERFSLLDGKTISRIGTYEAFCNKVVENVKAGKWKACTEEEFNLEVSETGQCGKFVVSNDYVRIPKLGNSLCSGVVDGKIHVSGNGNTLGFEDGVGTKFGLACGNQSVYSCQELYGSYLGTQAPNLNGAVLNKAIGITTDPTKSGIEGKINSVEVFYYMVISTEGQTASVDIDINKVYEDLNIKANRDLSNVDGNIDYVVESYNDGTNWYRIYKSGWIEQGGYSTNGFITFLKPFANVNYTFLYRWQTTVSLGTAFASSYAEKTTTNASMSKGGFSGDWIACGQGA